MTEPQDILAEALDYSMGPERRRRLAADILVKLTRAGYALVRTPETLDVERLRAIETAARGVVNAQYGLAYGRSNGPDPKPEDFTHYVRGEAIEALRAALAASPAPDPGAGPVESERGRPMADPALRSAPAGRIEDAAGIVVHAAGCNRALDDCDTCAALMNRATDETGSFDVAIADLRAALAPSAEPPETET